jgi:hypothetical protein
MPPGLKRRVLHILSGHKGNDNRIARVDLVKQAFNIFSDIEVTETQDRQVREVIADLRHEGNLICSDSGLGGYWMAGSYDDVVRMTNELKSRAMELLDQSRTLERKAMEWFGPQLKMKI